ncbi:MAG: carboxypeptidase-like regulatory domain-containing protein, partial [Bacteroidota bacterium]
MKASLHRSKKTMTAALVLMFTLFYQVVWSQQLVTGKVTDDTGQVIPGANVLVEGTTLGTTTDAEGKYSLSVNDGNSVLVFSFIGFTTQKVLVGSQTNIDVTMNPDLTTLEEVVVVGYGTMKKRDVTGAIASVNNKTIEERQPVNVFDALQGQAAGLQIVSESARPGASSTVRIRGTATIQGGA